jgi:Zn-dependent alcohol dehydrogenases, class III
MVKGEGKNVPATKYKLGDKIINSGPITTFSTYSVVSENRIVPIPAGLPKDIAVLFGCALPTGAGIIINEVRPDAKSSVVLIGMGGIGLSALFACSFFECDPIIAVDINQNKLDLAKKFGATHIINSIKKDPIAEVLKITNGVGVDISVEAAGKVKTIEMAFEMVRREGGNCVFASHPEANKKICLDPFELISGKRIQGTWGGGSNPDIDIPKIAEYYLNSDFPLELLITKTYNLEQINDALDDLESGKVFRPLIICNQ